jgi:hypothetical protein
VCKLVVLVRRIVVNDFNYERQVFCAKQFFCKLTLAIVDECDYELFVSGLILAKNFDHLELYE